MNPGSIYKRVSCPECGAPQGGQCRDRTGGTFKPIKPHPARLDAADLWQRTPSPDGLTPMRREEMIEEMKGLGLARQRIGQLMERVTKSGRPEAEWSQVLAEIR